MQLSLYCDSINCRQTETDFTTDAEMDKEFKDVPLSESNVSLRLADIQKRCSELLTQPDALELTLEEPGLELDFNNPYNRS